MVALEFANVARVAELLMIDPANESSYRDVRMVILFFSWLEFLWFWVSSLHLAPNPYFLIT